MANTLIQIKRSTSTAIPSTLNAAEPAYSYVSNTLFLGTSDGSGVIPIGGQYYVTVANTALETAIGAFNAANSAMSGSGVAGAAFDKANSANVLAYTASVAASAAFNAANGAFLQANTATSDAATAQSAASGAFNQANTATTNAATAQAAAEGAFATANNALPKAGGTITGDLVVQGNTTISGTVTYANTQTLLIGDNIFVVNADLPSDIAPSENAGFEVNRGSSANVALLWNEGTDKWTFTNDGTNYLTIASTDDVTNSSTIASAAFNTANGAAIVASAAYNQANTATTNAATAQSAAEGAFTQANTATTNAATAQSAAEGAFTQANSATTIASAAFGVANTALSAAANASYINTGTLAVAYGGTGVGSFTTNGVLYGNGTGALQVTSAGTEGQVLTVTASGAPQFAHLDGGSF